MLKKFLIPFALASILYFFFHKNEQKGGRLKQEENTPEVQERDSSDDKLELPSSLPSKIIRLRVKKNFSAKRDKKEFKTFEDFKAVNQVPQDEDGNIYITDILIDEEHLIAHGDIIVGNIRDIHKYRDDKKPLVLPRLPFGLVESFLS